MTPPNDSSNAPGGDGQRAGVFLDRDGTVLDELGYLASPDAIRYLPGAIRAIARLNEAGFAVVVITNQSGIARELLDEPTLAAIHRRMTEDLANDGARIDAFYHCPHHPEIGPSPWKRDCDCRKPKPGMVLDAARDLSLSLERSFAIGDSARDLESAARAGITRRILVRTGKGRSTEASLNDDQATVVGDLSAAVDVILAAG